VTALDATWKQLDELLMRAFFGHDGAAHTISRLAIDSGAYTQTVYGWARRYPMSRVIATKGMPGSRMLVGLPSPVEITVNGKKLKRGYKIWPVGVDAAKAELYGWLQLNIEDGETPPGYCHFPEHGEDYFKQLTAEHLVTVTNKRTRRTQMEWQVQPNRQNHMLDVRILARVAAATLGIDRRRPGARAGAKATPRRSRAHRRSPLAAVPAPPPPSRQRNRPTVRFLEPAARRRAVRAAALTPAQRRDPRSISRTRRRRRASWATSRSRSRQSGTTVRIATAKEGEHQSSAWIRDREPGRLRAAFVQQLKNGCSSMSARS
jgi:phage terminase large subunit GpA-like protein